jgi:hypothetical protein
MRHTVEIADTDGNTMQLSVSVDSITFGGSWTSLTKGMINHHNGWVEQIKGWGVLVDIAAHLYAAGVSGWGISLDTFISWGTVNDQGTGTIVQPWCIGLTPGAIEWSIV